ncbi:MAG: OmpA family protein [Paludibacteraceae bacterium]|nr:OmpA family protein [Paludibacteraceae bacterium]
MMKNAMKTMFLLLSLFLSASVSAQSKKEVKTYETAVIMINEGKYKEALPLLNGLVRENKKYVEASWTLADLHAKMRNDSKRIATLQYVAKPNMPRYYNTLMRLATAYHELCDYENAIKHFSMIPKTEAFYYKRAQEKIKQCSIALEFKSVPMPYSFKNMGKNINTEFDDYWPSITADESWFSTTVKCGQLEGQSSFGKSVQEDIFISKKGADGEWTPIRNIGNSINSLNNEGAQSLSLDGRYMFFVACNRSTGLGGCDIYYSVRMGDKWSPAINPGEPLNSRQWDTYPSLSPTGDELYFASTRPGGSGKSDIWKVKVTIRKDGMLVFSDPVNLGSVINTKDDEFSPFIHADNRTLYFSSRGRKGLGDYDVFVSYKDDEKKSWTEPKNLGYPLNSCREEIGFVVNAEGDKAYFSSDGQERNGRGREIYEVTLAGDGVKPKKKMKYAKGKIIDAETKKPMQAQIEVFSVKSNELVFKSVSDKSTGEFVACVPENEDFGVNVNEKGYMFVSEYFKENDPFKFDEKKGMSMEKIEVGKKMTLKNIFFDFDKYSLKRASYIELNHLIRFMKENPTVRIRLCGHTDGKGDHDYNVKLSENRAKAAYDYLVSKRIPKNRLEYKGFGPDQPIDTNATDKGRANNRRTEILIIGK